MKWDEGVGSPWDHEKSQTILKFWDYQQNLGGFLFFYPKPLLFPSFPAKSKVCLKPLDAKAPPKQPLKRKGPEGPPPAVVAVKPLSATSGDSQDPPAKVRPQILPSSQKKNGKKLKFPPALHPFSPHKCQGFHPPCRIPCWVLGEDFWGRILGKGFGERFGEGFWRGFGEGFWGRILGKGFWGRILGKGFRKDFVPFQSKNSFKKKKVIPHFENALQKRKNLLNFG